MFQVVEKQRCANASNVDGDGLHSCDQCNALHHMLYLLDEDMAKDSNSNLFPEQEEPAFDMSNKTNDALELHPDDHDMEIDHNGNGEAAETIAPNGASNFMPAPAPAVTCDLAKKKMSEDRKRRTLEAKVEELIQATMVTDNRLANAERRICEQNREIISLKRRRTDSAGNSVATASTTRSSSSSSNTSRVRDQDYSGSQEEAHQNTLSVKGVPRDFLPEALKDPKHSYNWRKQCTMSPLKRAKIIPKLRAQGIEEWVLEGMTVNDLMDFICLVASLLFNTGAREQVPDWLPAAYSTCPPATAMKKIEALSPAGYFSILRKPNFLSQDRMYADIKAYHTPDHLPTNDNPVQLIMECRGKYTLYRFGKRNVVAAARERREHMGSQAPPQTLSKPKEDLRSLLPPRRHAPDLRTNLQRRADPGTMAAKPEPARKKEVKMILLPKDPNYRGPGAGMGTGMMDVRERRKVEEARKKEKEAEQALLIQTAERMAAEEEEALRAEGVISSLTHYRDALLRRGGQTSGPVGELRSSKRTRSPTPSRSPPPAPSPSRTPPPSDRRRLTARSGKGKEKRSSFSRSPSRETYREARPTNRSVPGLNLGREETRAPHRTREFSPSCTPPRRRRSPSSPPRSPQWETARRRRRDRR